MLLGAKRIAFPNGRKLMKICGKVVEEERRKVWKSTMEWVKIE